MFSRVANTTTEINDTDGDGLSDEMEREGVILGGPTGDRVTADPKSADTDGDGLSDSKEIGQYTEVRYRGTTASYYNHLANPRQVDTDSDGLSDAREVRNTTIVAFDSRTEASALREAMVTENQSLNLQAAGTVLNVTSSPLNPDTDGDEISDADEWRYRTNPRQVDTDKDGVSDTTELRNGQDPTLHDIRGPDIKSLRTDSYNPGWSGPHYVLDFRVRDRSGLGTVRIALRGNETLDRANFTGHTQYHYSQDLTGNALQSAGTFAGGTKVYIHAYDSHGNKRHIPALTRSNNVVTNLQGRYDTLRALQGRYDTTAAGRLTVSAFGRGSGLMHGAGELGYTVSHPVETAAGLSQLPNAAKNYDRTYESMEEQFKNRQRVNNPFPPNTPENESFARGYFDGYVGFLILEEVTGAGVAKVAKDSSRVARAINKVDNTRYLGKSVTAARKMKYASELPARGVGRVASFGVDQAKRPFARYSLRNSRTVGKVVRTRRYVADKTPQKVYDLNTKQRKLSARYFRDADLGGRSPSELEAAGKLMAENNPKQVSRMLRRMDDSGQQAFLDPDMDPAVRRNLYDGWKAGRLVSAGDAAATARKYKRVDGNVKLDSDIDIDGVPNRPGITKKEQFRAILTHDSPRVRNTWMRTVSAEGIDQADIDLALNRYYLNTKIGHTPYRFLTGKRANRLDGKATDPHKDGSIAIEFEPSSQDQLYRVTSGRPEGEFLVRKSKLSRLETRMEVMNRLALKEGWGDYDSVSKVQIGRSETARIRVSTTSEVVDGTVEGDAITRDGGFTQYQIVSGRIEDDWSWASPRGLQKWLKEN